MTSESAEPDGHRGHDLHRFLTFIDACVAIAVTLLVLPLVEAAGDIRPGVGLHEFFDEHQNQLWSFLLSFGVIALIWTGHHTYVSLIRRADGQVFAWGLAWTLCLVLIPVPTALISVYDSDAGTVPIYIGLLLVSALCSTGLAYHVSRSPELWAEGVTAAEVAPIDQLVLATLYAAALVLGSLVGAINFFALLLLLLAGPITTWWRCRLFPASH